MAAILWGSKLPKQKGLSSLTRNPLDFANLNIISGLSKSVLFFRFQTFGCGLTCMRRNFHPPYLRRRAPHGGSPHPERLQSHPPRRPSQMRNLCWVNNPTAFSIRVVLAIMPVLDLKFEVSWELSMLSDLFPSMLFLILICSRLFQVGSY